MNVKNDSIKLKAIDLRKKGKTYSEIQKILKVKIPKSTLSNWCNGVFFEFSAKTPN